MSQIFAILAAALQMLLESSPYILGGLIIAGVLRVFIQPASVVRHLGTGVFGPVLKASLFGIPIPLCSCGVLPMAASLKRQGANKGAVTSFLVATPESGVDSIAITLALLGPLMAVVRPLSALCTAIAAGVTVNLTTSQSEGVVEPDRSCPVDGCCDGSDCPPEEHLNHHSFREKLISGFKFAFFDLWTDLAVWFLLGVLLSGVISALVPQGELSQYLGAGLAPKLVMLVLSLPMYICATASTPIAAALLLKGVSPGTLLVFLLAGPASNAASLGVIFRLLGKKGGVIYLSFVALGAVLSGIALDHWGSSLIVASSPFIAATAEVIPRWLEIFSAALLVLLWLKSWVISVRVNPKNTAAAKEAGRCHDCCD